jgi:hypothetical protein
VRLLFEKIDFRFSEVESIGNSPRIKAIHPQSSKESSFIWSIYNMENAKNDTALINGETKIADIIEIFQYGAANLQNIGSKIFNAHEQINELTKQSTERYEDTIVKFQKLENYQKQQKEQHEEFQNQIVSLQESKLHSSRESLQSDLVSTLQQLQARQSETMSLVLNLEQQLQLQREEFLSAQKKLDQKFDHLIKLINQQNN